MKSTFLNVALLSLLVAGVPMGVSSCKDYDSEIDQLQGDVDKINTQLATLETALAKAQSDADAAKALAQDALNKGLDQAAVDAIAKQAAATAKAEAISEAIAQCKELLKGYATTEDLNALASKVAGIESTLNTLGNASEVAATLNSLKTQVAALETFKQQIDALGLTDATNGYAALSQLVTAINGQVTALENTVNGTESSKGLKEIVADLSSQVSAINSNLLVLQGETLYGLVFVPEFYYEGIEAVAAEEFEYKSVTVQQPSSYTGALADAVAYPTWAQVWSKNITYVVPDIVAEYDMNPSTAVVPEDLTAYAANIADKNYVQGRADEMTAAVVDKEVKAGKLFATIRLSEGVLKTIADDDQVTTMQLAVTTKSGEKGDTVISSDFAAIYPENITDLGLYFTEETEPHTALYTTATAAIDAAKNGTGKVIDLPYDAVDGINIAQLVHTEYTINGKANVDWDKNATQEVVELDNFSYQFDLVGWANDPANKTSESAHAALQSEVVQNEQGENVYNTYLRAQMVSADGLQQAWGAEQAKATIGRMPLVRVFLVDNTSKKNATVGYMIFNITEGPAAPVAPIVVPIVPAWDDAYTLQCPLQGFDKTMSWNQFEVQILNYKDIDMSKAEFEEKYSPVYDATGTYFQQYVWDEKESKYVAATAAQTVGAIQYSTNADGQDYGTNVISWKVTAAELYALFVTNEKPVTTISVTGCFTATNLAPIYFTLTYTPSSIDANITSSLSNDLKISNYWYAEFSNNAGFGEVHQNVKVPNTGETAANCTFTTNMLNWFVANDKLGLAGIGTQYKGLQNKDLDKYFSFAGEEYTTVGVTGQVYQISAETEDLYATTSNLVAKKKLTTNGFEKTGTVIAVITLNPVNDANYDSYVTGNNLTITYQQNDYALDILSKYNSTLLAQDQTPYGTVAITAKNAACGIEVPVTNNEFLVRFLRPVNVYNQAPQSVVDAGTSGSIADLTKALSFADWRTPDAQSLFSTHDWYFTYYGFEKISVGTVAWNSANSAIEVKAADAGDVTEFAYCDLNGKYQKLTDIAPNLKLVYAPTSDFTKGLGTVTYYNNGETIHTAFNIWLPVVISYKWGWLLPDADTNNGNHAGYVMFTVNPTIGDN